MRPTRHPYSIEMPSFDHKRARANQGGHFCIVKGVAKIEFEDLVLTCPNIAEVVSRTGVLHDPLIKICRANGKAVILDECWNSHG